MEKIGALFGRIQKSGNKGEEVLAVTSLTYGYAVAIYLVSMFIATFCNVAFYSEILQALNGHAVSIRRGFKLAATKWKAILAWSLFAGLVGIIIRAIEERVDFAARWIVGLIGVAWNIASIFAIPVIIREEEASNPLKCLRSSARMLKKTWGEAAIGYIGLRVVDALFLFASLVFLACATAISICFSNYWIIAGAGVLWFLMLVFMGYVFGTAEYVYRAALFVYASEGVIPASYDREMMDMAWKIKKPRKGGISVSLIVGIAIISVALTGYWTRNIRPQQSDEQRDEQSYEARLKQYDTKNLGVEI